MGRTRRKFSSEEKLKMVMAVIQDGKAVSDVAQENKVHPNMILNWKKEFLENAAMIFDRHRPDITEKAQQRKIEELETKLKKKDEVIAEIAEENMMIKKTFGGRSQGKNPEERMAVVKYVLAHKNFLYGYRYLAWQKPPYFGCPSGRIGLLSSMFTNPNYRRKGIAKELLSRVVSEAKEYGCGTVQITASDMGVKLYTDFGFKHNGNFMHYKL